MILHNSRCFFEKLEVFEKRPPVLMLQGLKASDFVNLYSRAQDFNSKGLLKFASLEKKRRGSGGSPRTRHPWLRRRRRSRRGRTSSSPRTYHRSARGRP